MYQCHKHLSCVNVNVLLILKIIMYHENIWLYIITEVIFEMHTIFCKNVKYHTFLNLESISRIRIEKLCKIKNVITSIKVNNILQICEIFIKFKFLVILETKYFYNTFSFEILCIISQNFFSSSQNDNMILMFFGSLIL